MKKIVPRGYLTLEKALEHFGQLKHPDDWEAEKASSKQEFRQLLFDADLSAEVLTDDGVLHSLRSSIWGGVEADRIFETGRASISVGDEYFPATVHGPVLIKQSSIDALFDGDSSDPSPSTKRAETECRKWLTALMTDNSKPEKTKAAYKTEAQAEFSVGAKAFARAWASAIEKTGNAAWSKPGRKS